MQNKIELGIYWIPSSVGILSRTVAVGFASSGWRSNTSCIRGSAWSPLLITVKRIPRRIRCHARFGICWPMENQERRSARKIPMERHARPNWFSVIHRMIQTSTGEAATGSLTRRRSTTLCLAVERCRPATCGDLPHSRRQHLLFAPSLFTPMFLSRTNFLS